MNVSVRTETFIVHVEIEVNKKHLIFASCWLFSLYTFGFMRSYLRTKPLIDLTL